MQFCRSRSMVLIASVELYKPRTTPDEGLAELQDCSSKSRWKLFVIFSAFALGIWVLGRTTSSSTDST
ncbi:hypothetical protein LX36DRAFT_651506 [Colletotrichum falcatum]|nr:hypothetical protein LX36DRAFT_651506 [Colletotrichum falcatum]